MIGNIEDNVRRFKIRKKKKKKKKLTAVRIVQLLRNQSQTGQR